MLNPVKKSMLLLLTVFALAACQKGSDPRAARSSANQSNNVNGSGAGTSSCSSSAQATGRVYATSGASSSFEQQVKSLLSATVDPQYFGTISGDGNNSSNGVTMEGHLSYDGNGNVNLANTSLRLTVYDSYVGQTDSSGATIQAYPIYFSTASSGSVNVSAKTFTLQFKDTYGEINLQGTIGATTVTGTITYQNYTSFNNSSASSGTLGSFQISTCGWVQ